MTDQSPTSLLYWRALACVVVLVGVSVLDPELPIWARMLTTGGLMAAALLVIEVVHRRRS